MRRQLTFALVAVALSVACHAVSIVIVPLTLQPEPVEPQPPPETRLDIAAYPVEQKTLDPQTPDAEQAVQAEGAAPTATAFEIRRTEGAPVNAGGDAVSALQAAGASVVARQADAGSPLPPSKAPSERLNAATSSGGAAPEIAPNRSSLAESRLVSTVAKASIVDAGPPATNLSVVPITAAAVAPLESQIAPAQTVQATGRRATAVERLGLVVADSSPTSAQQTSAATVQPDVIVVVARADVANADPLEQIAPRLSNAREASPSTVDLSAQAMDAAVPVAPISGADVSPLVELAALRKTTTATGPVAEISAVRVPESSARDAARFAVASDLPDVTVPIAQAVPAVVAAVPSQNPQRAAPPARVLPAVATTIGRDQVEVAALAAAQNSVVALRREQPPKQAANVSAPEQSAPPLAPPDSSAPSLDARAQSQDAASIVVAGSVAAALAPPAKRATASLAWSGDSDGTVDPVSLAAIQFFMQPSDLSAIRDRKDDLRDGISDILAQVPCARAQTRFNAENGTLELLGHVPEDGLRAPVLAALQTQVGGSILIVDRMLILPRPQCNVLPAVAEVGLPQSTEQETNPKVIGPDAHVREYAYVAGQRLEFEAQSPDYDAVIYVDYFDADGNVIHLQPNEIVPLELLGVKSQMTVGRARDGKPSLEITIAPPYGQEIAVAFAASEPLYEGLRPFVEPADPYLEFLKDRVAELRASVPGFMGEWVYFFVTTRAE